VGISTQQLEAAKEEKTAFTNQVQELQRQFEKSGTISIYIILLIIAALVIGCIIGRFL
jgi:hypothetical protein